MVNETIAIRVIDGAINLSKSEDRQPEGCVNITRLEMKEIIGSMNRDRSNIKVTLNFGKNGNIEPEITLRGNTALEYILRFREGAK